MSTIWTVSGLQKKVDTLRGERDGIRKSLQNFKSSVRKNKAALALHEQARVILNEAGLKTQQQLQYHISDIASLAMNAVFKDPYEIVIEFVERRNKTECDIYFMRAGEKVKPLESSGGGTIDIASFALRIASWTMKAKKTNNVIFLDEPMKNLSPEFREKGSLMLKEVSNKLGIQFIIINHEPILTGHADRVFTTTIRNGITTVTQT